MYIPNAFAETDLDRLHGLIEAYDFGMLITNAEPTPLVSHLPFVLDRTTGPNGTLQAHMARANPQWQSFAGDALVVFRGPHSYVSPSWYESDSPAVPTWNYAVVEAYGTPRIIEDPAAVRAQQERLVATHEASRSLSYGKFKLSQNRSPADQHRVGNALADGGTEDGRALARLMAEG
jgi:transcriptional regulator